MPTLIWRTTLALFTLCIILLGANGCTTAVDEPDLGHSSPATRLPIPHSIVAEHEDLQRQLQEAISLEGETGAAAKLVADQLGQHFVKEEEYALPPLALLAPLAGGKSDDKMRDMIRLSEKLSAELPQMLNEHKLITLSLDRLVDAARKENRSSAIAFAERLREHARTEEEILYPSAILVGKYLKLSSEAVPARKR